MSADLIARLEAATGPDRNLDAAICNEIHGRQSWSSPSVDWCRLYHAKPTASIDAAVTLVPKPWGWILFSALANPAHAELHREGACLDAWAATPAIALCIASLKARAAA